MIEAIVAVLVVFCLLVLAWFPVDMGIQAMHRKAAGQPYAALGVIALGIGANVLVYALLFASFLS